MKRRGDFADIKWNGEQHRALILRRKGDQTLVHWDDEGSPTPEWVPTDNVLDD